MSAFPSNLAIDLWKRSIVKFKESCCLEATYYPFSYNRGIRLASLAVWLINHATSAGFGLNEREKCAFKQFLKDECSVLKEL